MPLLAIFSGLSPSSNSTKVPNLKAFKFYLYINFYSVLFSNRKEKGKRKNSEK
jgi:hypothetical protein